MIRMRPDGRFEVDLYSLLRPLAVQSGDAGQLARALLIAIDPRSSRDDLVAVRGLCAEYRASAGAWLGEALAAQQAGNAAGHFAAMSARERARATSEALAALVERVEREPG